MPNLVILHIPKMTTPYLGMKAGSKRIKDVQTFLKYYPLVKSQYPQIDSDIIYRCTCQACLVKNCYSQMLMKHDFGSGDW